MQGRTALELALAFTPGQLVLGLSIAALIVLAICLVIVSIVFGGQRGRRPARRQTSAPGKQNEAT